MHFLNDFLKNKNLQMTKIFPHLKCDLDEAKILHFMLENYLENTKDFTVSTLLKHLFKIKNNQDILKFLQKIKHLLELGWIMEDSFQPIKQMSLLEILYFEVSLTPMFFKLLEEGSLEIEIPEITPYQDHFEYLKDQFLRISLLQKLIYEKNNTFFSSKTKYNLKSVEEKILARLKITKINIPAYKIIQENHLSPQEEIIFFTLLKEEYSGGNENFRDMNILIELISIDEYDRIKNRSLFDEKSTLIEKKILDYDEIINPFGGISRTFYIHEDILQKILYPKITKQKQKISLQTIIQEQDFFEILEPKIPLDNIVLTPLTQNTLQTLLKQIDPKVTDLLRQWGIKNKKNIDARIILYGPSGTGKTLTALGIAKSLKKQVLSLDCSKILSMYIGESEKNVRKIFDNYKDIVKKIKNPPILLLDEADQFLSLRANSGSGAEKMHNQMQNIFLEQIEKFDGILIATTNLLDTIDSAFSRRFNYKIEFKKPTQEQRKLLWTQHLPKNAKFKSHSIQTLAEKLCTYNLSGGQIALIVKNTAYQVAVKKNPVFEESDFIENIQKELKGMFGEDKNLGFQI
ncbi:MULTISPECIES: AAA family ATPase [unclassified Helicobacter]|uniref:AAA family ATPase n=1 Tax=unclassified Helicobacter TaxID=2593540 RepID=UPI000CF02F96|nr:MULTISPECIES: ATP-binding protein [unclassified Helicobacter]